MSNMKYCQGTRCHTYDTKDRKKGSKGNKRNETRKSSSFYYGQGNFLFFTIVRMIGSQLMEIMQSITLVE